MNRQEIISSIALTKLEGLSLLNAHVLLDHYGSAQEVFAHQNEFEAQFNSARLKNIFRQAGKALQTAEQEMDIFEKKGIKALVLNDEQYPQRLRECADAPLVLYTCGSVDLNAPHIINIIGTRKCTERGRELTHQFVKELKEMVPDTLIVSGLAYGIDICAHRAALEYGMKTVGVLAHGLEMIYPSMHRETAGQMVHSGGGLLTEYPIGTKMERHYFVQRNRIVAGLSDACVVIESSARGGSLITARLAFDYNRSVFAFPGRVTDESSIGCLNIIKEQEAALITCAEDLVNAMGWPNPFKKDKAPQAIQQELFLDLTEEEQRIVNVLKTVDDKHVNQLAIETNIPYSRTVTVLFELEMKGIVKEVGGARYRLARS